MSNSESQNQKSPQALREEAILAFWKENDIFKKSLEKEAREGEFVFFEGPPTANAKPALHHLEARAFKDVVPRYKTMQGFHVRRRAGWDTHGLPVELQIEKMLGFTHKKQIEEYGIAKFNKECKDSVFTYIKDWEVFTDRIGYWVDQDDAYYTFDTNYIESLWHIFAKVDTEGLLYKDYKVVPWCPRCGTTLASHELAQGYQDDKDLSVTAKFELIDHAGTYFLAWTTTPWTLPGNVGLAVGPDIEYVKVVITREVGINISKGGQILNSFMGQIFILAKERLEIFNNLLDGRNLGYEIVEEVKGSDLIGLEYKPPYPYLGDLIKGHHQEKNMDNAYKVYAADFVTTTDGTGIVHTAVMYGADDFDLGTKVGLPKFHTVDVEGNFVSGTGFLVGRFVKDEDVAVDIIKDLAHRGLLFKKEKYEHSYPHCWRCKTPLIYYARDSWYIGMSQLRDKLITENEAIDWEPSYIKEGRFGEWLREVKDWAISRERYWGTPLPIWHNEHDGKHDRIVVDSIDTLKKYSKGGVLPINESGELDLHRPYIDDIVLEKDGKEFHRVKEVMDVWFDSGSMPFAQDHYPFDFAQDKPFENKELLYPADFISEAIDQTRGWFYTLLAIGVLMGKGKAYKNVICLGLLLDADGKKMSKSIGNIVEPFAQIDKFGVDTVRLWMYSVNQSGESKNYDEKTVGELQRQVFGLLYNVLAFYELYRDPHLEARPPSEPMDGSNVLDAWIATRLDQLIGFVTGELDHYRVMQPVREIRAFIEDLSTWYVRRSRERIKSSPAQGSGGTKDDGRASIDGARHDSAESAKATLYRVLKVLAQIMAPFAPFTAEDIWQKLKNENDSESVHLVQWPKPMSVSEELLQNMKTVRDICTTGNALRKKAGIPVRQPLGKLKIESLKLSSEYIELIKEELNVKEVVEGEATELDTAITPELKAEGNYRELVRAVQDMRKAQGLEPSDSVAITLSLQARPVMEPFLDDFKKTVQAKEVTFADNDGQEIKIDETVFRAKIEK